MRFTAIAIRKAKTEHCSGSLRPTNLNGVALSAIQQRRQRCPGSNVTVSTLSTGSSALVQIRSGGVLNLEGYAGFWGRGGGQ
jgi:hypothetical protein